MPALRLVDRSAPAVSSCRLCSAWSTLVAVVQNVFCCPSTVAVTWRPYCTAILVPSTTEASSDGADDVVRSEGDPLAGEHVAHRPAHGGDLAGLAVDGQGHVVVQGRVGEGRAGDGEGGGPSRDDGDDLAHVSSLVRIR